MRKIILVVFVLQLVSVSFWGYGYAHADKSWVDPKTGILVKVGTPEDTITSYYQLVMLGNYKEAVRLQSENSQNIVTVDVIKAQNSQLALEGAKLARVFPPKVDKDIAVVGLIRTVTFPGNAEPTAIYTVNVVKRNKGNFKWEIIQDLREIPENRVMKLFQNTLALDDMLLTDNSLYTDFTENQQIAIANQVRGMRFWHAKAIEEFKLYLKEKDSQGRPVEGREEEKENQEKTTADAVDEKVYADEGDDWESEHKSLGYIADQN